MTVHTTDEMSCVGNTITIATTFHFTNAQDLKLQGTKSKAPLGPAGETAKVACNKGFIGRYETKKKLRTGGVEKPADDDDDED